MFYDLRARPQGYKTIFVLNSAEHEIYIAHKYQIAKVNEISGLNHKSQSLILLLNVKMPIIVGILTFVSRINFMLS